MNDITRLIRGFRSTQWIIDNQCAGLTHEESLLQLPFRGNCLNWILGHLAVNRNRALEVIGLETHGPENLAERYGRGSAALEESVAEAVPLETLLGILRTQQAALESQLKTAAPQSLDAIADTETESSVLEVISGLHWHETYHSGQLEILRQLTGTDDAVIP